MTLRTVPSPAASAPANRPHQLERVLFVDGQLFAEWVVTLPTGRRESRTVAVSDAVKATLTGRASFVQMLDAIEADSFGRTGAQRG